MNKSWVVYAAALFYMSALTYGWLGPRALVTTADYFTQSGLILAALGFYNAEPPNTLTRKRPPPPPNDPA